MRLTLSSRWWTRACPADGVCVCVCVGRGVVDLIKDLPGWDGDNVMYAGLMEVEPKYGSNMFYWLTLADEEPENKPVVLWLTGGPGYVCVELVGS